MHVYITTHDLNSPVIIITNLCKLKKYYGVMGISNVFFTTKLIFDDDFPVKEYRSRQGSNDVFIKIMS
jgi:hypothetical protein